MAKTLRDLVKAPPLTERELQLKTLEYITNELQILRLYPSIIDRVYSKVKLPTEILSLLDVMIEKGLSEINSIIVENHKVTGQHYKAFLKWWVERLTYEVITDEYLMILNVKKFAESQRFIEGKYLKFEILNESLEILDQPCKSLIDNCVDMLQPLILAYKENNSKWLETFMQKHQELYKMETNNVIETRLQDINPLLPKVHKYYVDCQASNQKATITGLSRELGIPRQSLVDRLGPELNTKIKEWFKKNSPPKK